MNFNRKPNNYIQQAEFIILFIFISTKLVGYILNYCRLNGKKTFHDDLKYNGVGAKVWKKTKEGSQIKFIL